MKQVDYLIVGQGLAGTMLAFELMEKKIDFKIVSSPHKSKASLVAAGMVNPLVFKRLTKSWAVDELLPFMLKKYRELEAVLGDTFYYEKQILKPLSEQENDLWQTRSKEEDFTPYIDKIVENSPVEEITSAQAYGLVKNTGYLNLARMLENAEKYFDEKGLLIRSDFNEGAMQVNGSFTIQDINAKNVVFCEGYHLKSNVLFDQVKMNPTKGEVLLIHAPELSEEYIVNKLVFVLPVGKQHFKVGSTYEWEDLSEETSEKGELSIRERLDRLVKSKYEVVGHWAGVRPTIADRRPVLGKHPEHKNLFVFNGLGTKGVMLAPKMAQTMGRFLVENDTLPDEINIDRFYA